MTHHLELVDDYDRALRDLHALAPRAAVAAGLSLVAAGAGTLALVGFALSRGGAQGADLVADLLIVGAVLSSSWCYVEGASITKVMPGWQVISWVVVLALPVTVPASIVIGSPVT